MGVFLGIAPVRRRDFRGMLAAGIGGVQERAVAVELVMQVSRGEDDRLSGTVRVAHGADGRDFSGTLELMRVFEELVPPDQTGSRPGPSGSDRGDSRQ